MSLFGLIKKDKTQKKTTDVQLKSNIEKEMYRKNIGGYRDAQNELNYQNRLLDGVNAAKAQYKEDGNLEQVIKALEYAFIQADPPCKTSQNMDLVNYYLKAGQNDKAWAYINRLQVKQQAPLVDTRFAQAKILKKEKKWADAIQMYMLGYLAKSQWLPFREDMFKKDILSSANQLRWGEDIITRLTKIISAQVKKKNFSEGTLINEYRKVYSELAK